jgi:hypothetical protein
VEESSQRAKVIELFEKHRATPGASFDEQHFLDFLLRGPRKTRAVYDSFRGLRRVVDRLRRNGREHIVRHLNYPEAGHVLFPYEAPDRAEMPFDLGGGVEAANAAHASAWPHVLRHFRSEAATPAHD